MNKPLVSVCIPVFNTAKYVKQTIDSVLAQQHSNIEILIQDNASTDGTWELLEALATDHPQIKIERNQINLGMSGNWNTVIKRAQGDYVMLLSADDLLAPEFLSSCIKAFEDDDVDFVSTHYHYLFGDDLEQERVSRISDVESIHQDFASDVLKFNPFLINFTLFRKSVISKLQGNGNLFSKYVTCDYGLFLRLGASQSRMKYLARSLGHYRIHESNTSNNQIRLQWHTLLTLLNLLPSLFIKCPVQYLKTTWFVSKRLLVSIIKKIIGRK